MSLYEVEYFEMPYNLFRNDQSVSRHHHHNEHNPGPMTHDRNGQLLYDTRTTSNKNSHETRGRVHRIISEKDDHNSRGFASSWLGVEKT